MGPLTIITITLQEIIRINIAKIVFENCNMCNINVDFVQDDNDNYQYNENEGMN
ncbi:hypothetical protein PFAG_01229 [Plasmodium falciparum Santa Lucia]|uniref:Uncharacterized protein n=1 Tax=Plasmodium falciparum Santa Lucia TaxID=478859 RepID=W7FTM3_PLAFA|nr:hypothetical protein PFAG_01229 [Plasmodium falciparum Santa Lucia]